MRETGKRMAGSSAQKVFTTTFLIANIFAIGVGLLIDVQVAFLYSLGIGIFLCLLGIVAPKSMPLGIAANSTLYLVLLVIHYKFAPLVLFLVTLALFFASLFHRKHPLTYIPYIFIPLYLVLQFLLLGFNPLEWSVKEPVLTFGSRGDTNTNNNVYLLNSGEALSPPLLLNNVPYREFLMDGEISIIYNLPYAAQNATLTYRAKAPFSIGDNQIYYPTLRNYEEEADFGEKSVLINKNIVMTHCIDEAAKNGLVTNETHSINNSIWGNFTLTAYLTDELVLSFNKTDINNFEGSDKVSITITKEGERTPKKIFFVEDDNITNVSSQSTSSFHQYKLNIDPGVYFINVTSLNGIDDFEISNLTINTNKAIITGPIKFTDGATITFRNISEAVYGYLDTQTGMEEPIKDNLSLLAVDNTLSLTDKEIRSYATTERTENVILLSRKGNLLVGPEGVEMSFWGDAFLDLQCDNLYSKQENPQGFLQAHFNNDRYLVFDYSTYESIVDPFTLQTFSRQYIDSFESRESVDYDTHITNTTLRGEFTLLGYFSQSVDLDFTKEDLNWYNGEDDVILNLADRNGKVLTRWELLDDGVDDNDKERREQDFSLHYDLPEKGFYYITVQALDPDIKSDFEIRNLSVNTNKLMVVSEFLPTTPTDLYFEDIDALQVRYWHEGYDQNITLSSSNVFELNIYDQNNWKWVDLSAERSMRLEKGDVFIRGENVEVAFWDGGTFKTSLEPDILIVDNKKLNEEKTFFFNLTGSPLPLVGSQGLELYKLELQ
ncbi:hypothetical protein H6501_05415 [Candidatus Woesearchaeota archaeon]|nr:hypothetical protein [Candidatus Woesearchaeota archaeon]USN44124.1 MAG: hypothetical protein H6500_07090 [Candidatus Woesearchaeota archaeon]